MAPTTQLGGVHNLTQVARLSPPVDTSLPYDASRMAGKTALITGGAQGLGAEFARHWASLGANVVIGDIDDAAGERLIAECRGLEAGGTHHFFHCDVTDWDAQTALFKAAAGVSPHGGIDVVVANAGVNLPGANNSFEAPKGSAADPDAPSKPNMKILEINITAAMYTAHLGLFWLPRNGGRNKLNPARDRAEGGDGTRDRDRCLILLGSAAGLFPCCGQSLYTTSKHAITGMFRALRGTAWASGVRVCMLCPYFVEGSNMFPDVANAAMLAGTAGGAKLEDVVDAATRLAADDGIVGRALYVGPKIGVAEFPRGRGAKEGQSDERAIWDCYAEDFLDSESFVWRYVRALNAIETARGWFGYWRDIAGFLPSLVLGGGQRRR